jgi:hypothetical protein
MATSESSSSINFDLPEDTPSKPVSFQGTYDLSYSYEAQTVLFFDIEFESYYPMPYHLFWAFIQAHYQDLEVSLRIRDSVLNFKSVRIIPSRKIAGIKPINSPNYEKLVLRMMNETIGVEFRSGDERKNFFLQNYGIEVF